MKKILVILPDIPSRTHQDAIEQSLLFLKEHQYELTFIDPYDYHCDLDNLAFYKAWQGRLESWCEHYDAFMGFSYGGVIIQQCLNVFDKCKKPVVLFSSPSFADETLYQKLEHVVALCQNGQLTEALQSLYQWVYQSSADITPLLKVDDHVEAVERVVSGLKRVMSTDSRPHIKQSSHPYIHFIGERSRLVTDSVVTCGPHGKIINVPSAGMRILKDNPEYCQPIILDYLSCHR